MKKRSNMKKIATSLLSVIMVFTLAVPAFAMDKPEITEDEVLTAISNGTAEVVMEAIPISSYTEEDINADEGLKELFDNIASLPSTTSSHSSTISGTVYQSTVQYNGDTVKFRLYPTAELNGGDVPTAGGTPMSTDLHVFENVTINGVVNSDWENLIYLSNIKGAMGCGKNTLFSGYTQFLEDVYISDVSLLDILAIIAAPVSLADYGTSGAIISALSVIEYSGSYRTGSSIGNNVREIGYKWNSKVKLRDSADCIGFQSTVITHDSTQARSVSTTAAARWEFDVYFGEATGTPKYSGVTITPNFAYLVNV